MWSCCLLLSSVALLNARSLSADQVLGSREESCLGGCTGGQATAEQRRRRERPLDGTRRGSRCTGGVGIMSSAGEKTALGTGI